MTKDLSGFTRYLKKKSLFRDIFTYGTGNFLFALVNLLLTPFLTRNYSISQYGAIDLIYTTILIISLSSNLGLDSSLIRFYFDDTLKKQAVVTTVFVSSFFSSLLFCLASLLFFIFWGNSIFKTSEELNTLFVALLCVPFMVCLSNEFILLRAQRKSLAFAILSFATILLTLLLTVVFVKFTGFGLKSFFLAVCLSQGTAALAGLYYLRGNFSRSSISLKLNARLFSFGAPLLVPALFGTFMAPINKYFLQHYQGLSNVAIFSIGIKISSIISFMGMSFRQAWIPYAFSIMKDEDAKRKFNRVFRLFISAVFVFSVAIILLGKTIILFLSSSVYLEAYSILSYLCLAVIFTNLAGNFFNFGLLIEKKTVYSMSAYIIGFIVNIILVIWLVPNFSITGAAVAVMASNFTIAGLLLVFSNKFYRINYDLKLLTLCILLFLLFFIAHNSNIMFHLKP